MPRRPEPHDMPQTPAEHELQTFLEQDRAMRQAMGHDLTTRGYAYASISDFLLRHGRWYRPQPLLRRFWRGAPNACYGNALAAGLHWGLRYVEGFAISYVIPTQHAWGADAEGRLYELTWKTPGTAYLGVEFSLERADHCTWFGNATVLDDYRRHWPLLRQPWTGEPAVSLAQPSPWLTLMRAGKLDEAQQWLINHQHDDERSAPDAHDP